MSNIVTTNVSGTPIKDKQLLIDPESGKLYFDHGDVRVELGGSEAPVSSVNGKTGEVVLTAEDVDASPAMEYYDLDADVDISDDMVMMFDIYAEANRYYYSASGKVVNIALDVRTVPITADEIVFEFTRGTTGQLAFPVDLRWFSEPTFEEGKTYVISIVNNIAVAAEVTV